MQIRQAYIKSAIIIWALAITASFAAFNKYDFTPGEAQESPNEWPYQSKISIKPHHFNLIMFAHPHCSCTRSSLKELEKIVDQVQDKIHVSVLFIVPPSLTEEWAKAENWNKAASIPKVNVFTDLDGIEAEIFGAKTSGHVLLFDPNGKLLFSGGITASRGHEGCNLGENSIISFIQQDINNLQAYNSTPVFGCSLFNQPNKLGKNYE